MNSTVAASGNDTDNEFTQFSPTLGERQVSLSSLPCNEFSFDAGRTNTKPNEVEPLQENSVESYDESPFHQRQRKKSHLVIYATTFIMSIGFSIVLTGIWPYLKALDPSSTKEFLGWVIAINPLGQMIASPLLGWWGSHRGSNRCSFIVTLVMFIVGNVIYAVLPIFKRSIKYIMLISRFIVGISSANIAICRSYISSSTKQKERTFALSVTAAAQSMGFILGPSIQTALAYIHPLYSLRESNNSSLNSSLVEDVSIPIDSPDKNVANDVFNMYSLSGWFTAVLGFFNFFLFLPCVYKEFSIAAKEESNQATGINSSYREDRSNYLVKCVILFGYFSVLLIFVLVETLIVPMCLDLYAWTPEFTVKVVGIALTISGVIAFFIFILGGRLASVFNDRKVYIFCGLIPLSLALLSYFPVSGEYPKIKNCDIGNGTQIVESYSDDPLQLSVTHLNKSRVRRAVILSSEGCDDLGCPPSQEWCKYTPVIHIPQLIVASCLLTIGYPVCVSLLGAIFSKISRAKEQGLWMGILTSSGSLSRFIGPIFVSYLYTAKGPLWTFGSLLGLILFVTILSILFYKRMAPLSERRVAPN